MLNEILLAILLSADAYKIDGKICADLVFDIENQEDLSQRQYLTHYNYNPLIQLPFTGSKWNMGEILPFLS